MSVVFEARERAEFGSRATKNLRKSGNIPAIIYNKSKNLDLVIDANSFEKEYFKGNLPATVVEIELGNKKLRAIAHDITLDPVTDKPIHVDFISCDSADNIRAKPKFKFEGREKSPGLKRGGFLNVALRRVDVLCSSKSTIPTEITVDVGSLHISDKVRASDIKLPEGVKFSSKNNFLICSITGRGKSTTGDSSESTEANPSEESKGKE